MDDHAGDPPTIASEISGVAAVVAGRYRVRARLGRGATKEVYLAYDERLDREVALAIVVGGSGSAAARARVTREAQVTGRLGDHPNVITVYDTGEHEGVPYLVLRAMPGGSLADLLHRERPAIGDALRLGGEIAAALAHAHAHDVVHRDVKPDNVWLAADGTAALGDFGIAHRLGLERLTAEGIVVGTVRYLSPEQIRGEEIGPASDLYALGVTLYELVTGRTPFRAKDATAVLTQHLTAQPEPPSDHEPAVPQTLEDLILALLSKDAERRPAATEVVAALAAIAAGPSSAGARAASPARTDARRFVSVLAARASVGDPEVLHALFERCGAVIEQHGGTIERHLGDGLVGFFGLEASHDDDALRAARAAVEVRAALPELRLGIEAGEVFLGTGPRGAPVATGAAIGTADRLAAAARESEILLGDSVRRVVGADADVDPASGRLVQLQLERPALLRTPTTPFIGRSRELDELNAALDRARDERTCCLVTIAGSPGIGKSRLAGEFLTAIGERATILTGRCLAYGEGTTYRAIADLVRGLGAAPRARVEELLAGDEQAARSILAAVGLLDGPAAVQADETSWALRRLLARLARERPVVVAIEDIHWAQPVLLDLLDHLVSLSSGSAILVVCLTRPELLEARPEWAAPQPNRAVLMLDGLADEQARQLAERLGAADVAGRIAQRAEGNPLFVEQLVAVDEGRATGDLPASIQAVLAARIDRLDEDERVLLRHAAVEGRTFHAGMLASVVGGESRRAVTRRLVALARKGLIGGDQPHHAGEDAFRFTHALIRDAAYAGLPKGRRGKVHADVAGWLEGRAHVADEIIGFHLEQACLLAAELGRSGERERELATRAIARLQTAAHDALTRGDATAASGLLERAVALAEPDRAARLALLPALGTARFEAGRIPQAAAALEEAIAHATDPQVQARARVERELLRFEEDDVDVTQMLRLVDAVLPALRRAGDDRGQCRAWGLRALCAWFVGHVADADAAWVEAAACARRAGDERELQEVIGWRGVAAALGPTPVDEAIERCEEFLELVRGRPYAAALARNPLATVRAMRGEFELADRLLGEAYDTLRQLGGLCSGVSHAYAVTKLIEGQPALAEAPLREDVTSLEEMGVAGGALATTYAMLAQAVIGQGRIREAAELSELCAAVAVAEDVNPQVIWRSVQARVLAHEGRCERALALAREAVAIAEETDLLNEHGDAMLALGEVLGRCGRRSESADAVRAALALYERKGNTVSAARARTMLA